MGKEIKMRLLQLDKKQVDLLAELWKRGYPNLHKTQLSTYINGHDMGPQAQNVKQIIYDILDEWENEAQ